MNFMRVEVRLALMIASEIWDFATYLCPLLLDLNARHTCSCAHVHAAGLWHARLSACAHLISVLLHTRRDTMFLVKNILSASPDDEV